MFYSIAGKSWSAAVVTMDGRVIRATANFEWACGRTIHEVLLWAATRNMHWSVSAVVPRGIVMSSVIMQNASETR